ncbi:MAG TPA: dihydrofolate reductase family protein [Acidobacteriota bacterium]|nr:dihydrofolate reductase family protein [Acidobacteriota bacterium]
MGRIRYVAAMSLDGYIAGPNGEADWIIMDPEINFQALFAEFDTILVGRKTFEKMPKGRKSQKSPMPTFVFSQTLRPEDYPNVTIVSELSETSLSSIRAQAQKDIWLFGGGGLFRSLLEARQVDSVETAIIPVLLGGGIPLLPTPAKQTKLTLTEHKVYQTGIVSLVYSTK